jgi:hypothetical protein
MHIIFWGIKLHSWSVASFLKEGERGNFFSLSSYRFWLSNVLQINCISMFHSEIFLHLAVLLLQTEVWFFFKDSINNLLICSCGGIDRNRDPNLKEWVLEAF